MEDLNKNQLILLTLLVSFVTSIATGIITVSLLQEAPVEVTRNINRVVEKTIEKVTPSTTSSSQKEVTTVVVKEDDMVVDSINKNLAGIVRINNTDGALGTKSFYGLGVIVSKDGIICADRQEISTTDVYSAVFSDGVEHKLVPLGVNEKTNSIFFKVNLPVDSKYKFSPVALSSADPQLGQTIIGISGETKNKIEVGRVTSFITSESGTGTSTVKYVSGVETDVSFGELISGSPIFNLSGDLVGMKLSKSSSGTFIPITIISKELNAVVK